MSDLFYDTSGVYSSFNEDISGWDTSNVESMDLMFGKANSFNKPIGNWNVESVTSMFCMFYYAASFNQDISSWNVSKVTSMGAMFRASSFNSASSFSLISPDFLYSSKFFTWNRS